MINHFDSCFFNSIVKTEPLLSQSYFSYYFHQKSLSIDCKIYLASKISSTDQKIAIKYFLSTEIWNCKVDTC